MAEFQITVVCCGGDENSSKPCYNFDCPLYREVRKEQAESRPFVGTGLGNLYGEPSHKSTLARVRELFTSREKKENEEKTKKGEQNG